MSMTSGGWLFAGTAWLAIIALTAWCMSRLLTKAPRGSEPGADRP